MGQQRHTFRYRVDRDNVVVWIDGDWDAFARDNGGPACFSKQVVEAPLESFIGDPDTWQLYEIVLARVRATGRTVKFDTRCDGPDVRRYGETELRNGRAGHVEITSRILAEEPRRPIALLQPGTPRSDHRTLRICSICKRVRIDHDDWMEIEEAIPRLGLERAATMPRLSHGLCDTCYREVIDSL